jgi:hypothetical protein
MSFSSSISVPDKTVSAGVYVPQCNPITFEYNYKQSLNGLSWCVNAKGIAVAGTLYQGWDLQCDSKGKTSTGTFIQCWGID